MVDTTAEAVERGKGAAKKTGETSVADLLLGYSETDPESFGLEDIDPSVDAPGVGESEAEEETASEVSGIATWSTLGGLLIVSLCIAAFVLVGRRTG